MYLMITTFCNMSCPHCFMGCGTNYVGMHMDMEVFYASMSIIEHYEINITIGGGEPTLHPNFKNIMMECLFSESPHTFIVTNGSNAKLTHKLLNFGQNSDNFAVEVSLDYYHDPIDPDLENRVRLSNKQRDVSHHVSSTGHAKFTGAANTEDHCVCPALQVKPDGTVYACGCDDAPYIGHVLLDREPIFDHIESGDGCFKDAEHIPDNPHKYPVNRDWVNAHQPVRKGREHHPDTHRIKL